MSMYICILTFDTRGAYYTQFCIFVLIFSPCRINS